jgi:cytochrome c556
MMIRTVLAVAAIAFGASAALAQDPIAARKDIMKGVGGAARTATQMVRGEAPFELAKAQGVFATYAQAADKMPALFPDNSKTGGDTTAAPKIWEDMAGFKAGFAKLGTDAKAAQAATKDLETFKVQIAAVGKNCGGCHELYRIKK